MSAATCDMNGIIFEEYNNESLDGMCMPRYEALRSSSE